MHTGLIGRGANSLSFGLGRVDDEGAIALQIAIHGVKTRGTPTQVIHNFCA
jgi:hypothetical protein